ILTPVGLLIVILGFGIHFLQAEKKRYLIFYLLLTVTFIKGVSLSLLLSARFTYFVEFLLLLIPFALCSIIAFGLNSDLKKKMFAVLLGIGLILSQSFLGFQNWSKRNQWGQRRAYIKEIRSALEPTV